MDKNSGFEKYRSLFLEEYGIKNPDWKKSSFYILLDEFF
jgi:aminoglycoside phosphotransferase